MKALSLEIHENAVKTAAEYKKSEAALISAIQQVDQFRVYFDHGCGSLFEYVARVLGLSESSAYNFIAVARKSMEIPEIKREIEKGNLTVSKVRKVLPVINAENQDGWLSKAMTLSQRALEVEVAKIAPRAALPERVRVVTESLRELRMSISTEVYEKLRRAQNIERTESLEDTLVRLLDFHAEKKDPVKRAEKRISSVGRPVLRQVALRTQVQLRDRGRCTFVDPSGRRCENERFVEIHHVTPKSLGGPDTLENLTTLCSGHHRMVHAS